MVAIREGPVDDGSDVTGPRFVLKIPQDMFEVESCLRNAGVQLLPCRNCLLLALGWSKTKGQWQRMFIMIPVGVCSIGRFGIVSYVDCTRIVLGYDRPAKVCSMDSCGVMSNLYFIRGVITHDRTSQNWSGR